MWRPTQTADGSGGYTTSYVNQGLVDLKVDQSSAAEQVVAAQAGANHSHNAYADPDEDIQRKDLLVVTGVDPNSGSGEMYQVKATTTPSTPIYLKCQCERIESA